MKSALRLVAFLLYFTLLATAQGNTWNKVRYNGGTLQTKVDPKDWDNHLTVASDLITLKLKDGQAVEILSKSVTGLSYGQEAHRRVGTMVGLALISPVALFGLLHKTRLHFIGIEYAAADEKKSGLLLQGDKDNYRAILLSLHSVTNAPLTVSEKDRSFVPMGISTSVTKGSDSAEGSFATPQDEEARQVAKVKANVAERGAGQKARVTVKLRNKTEVKGYISQVGEDSFTITDSKTGHTSTVDYRDVTQVKGKGRSTDAKIVRTVAIGAIVVVVAAFVAFATSTP